MGLSDDQRALLRLLAQREEGYADIAALMGLSVEEVRARVKDALGALDEGAPAAGPVAEGRSAAAAGPVAAGDPPPPAVAEASSGAVPPAAPPAEEAPAPRTAKPRPSSQTASSPPTAPSLPRIRLPRDRRRLVELIGGALVVLLIVLFATGAVDIGGNDSDSDSAGTTAPSSPVTGATGAANGQLTEAILEPVDGSDAEGRALFGRIGKNVVLQVTAEGLEPSPPGEAYSIWLYRSPKLVLRVGAVKVGEDGRLAAQLPIPAELLGFVANGAFDQIAVSLLSEAEYESALAAAKEQKQLPGYLGEDILRGRITGPAIKN